MITPELHRPVRLDRFGPDATVHEVDASDEECRALAERFGIPAVLSLRCRLTLRRLSRDVVAGSGQLTAQVVRVCGVTLDNFEMDVTEAFSVRFVPEGTESADIDPETEDEIPYSGDVIDLGEAAAEQLALALKPYPRRPGAELAIGEQEPEVHPFAALEELRRRH
ncbi:MAG: DUF177 domain-containing protein [Acetobacteraceae bacterium]|nr:DUF177 domain-containing protein [Acetobacteraceae bacterium]